ncbi:NACHT, LRR and PYD domains-containing protein 12-like isoform X2 [Alosa sapidissima]|uniref:NACHT, LRR and PYD domains-containing protein 12-like isoform X2 n=1 Tax=Alosa sapidissima TaxID=34773 RepID=UPI001C080877|nr:NACHT, LRR and PYD domains-containing protein 12-like isoform X2 [Alosa sapidissima]
MCHIPIFCWIAATVFENMFDANKPDELPQTLTEMYTHFLIIQTCMKNRKYNGAEMKPSNKMSNSDKEMIMKLGELAFSQLSQGNLIFYEDDLKECGIDINKASEYSSLCTEIFREENGLYSERVFCFIHLSIQEFLAAVYVHVSCVQNNVDVLSLHRQRNKDQVKLSDVHKRAVEKALQSPKGNLDLFLRFLLGLSREDKQTFLQDRLTARSGIVQKIMGLMKPLFSNNTDTDLTPCVDETICFIKQKIRALKEAERTINMLHCLSELKDNSLVTGILNDVVSGKLSGTRMEPDKCSALTYVVLMSGEVLEVFDLKRFKTSAVGQQRLLCALKACKHGRLGRCKITAESCEIVASALQSENSPLIDLELSKNCIGDKGVNSICTGLTSSHCNLAKLRMDGCSLSAESCKILALALQSENSPLTELDLSYNNIRDEGVTFLWTGVTQSKLAKLSLARCALTVAVCGYLASAVEANSTLTELNLSHNNVTDLGMEMLCNALMSAQCKLSRLKVAACDLTSESCKSLTKVLQSETSSLSYLDLNFNDIRDLGVKLLFEGLINANCKIQVLKLSECSLTEDSCEYLAYVLQSPTSKLIRLKLEDNDLRDTGVMLLSAGLQHANCRLQSLGLTGCGIEEDGVCSLACALDHNKLHLQELYLNFNTLGAGIKCLSEQKSNPEFELDTLITNYSEDKRLHPGPKKYFYELTLDDRVPLYKIFLSHEDRTMSTASDQTSNYEIMLCKEPLTKKCYWEVEVSGDRVEIGVSSRTRYLEVVGDEMGRTGFFPCLVIYLNKLHGFLQNRKIIANCPEFYCPHRIGLYLNKHAEYLAFYSVGEDKLTLLGKFYSTDVCKLTSAGKLFAAFKMYSNSTVKLCGSCEINLND